MTCTDSPSVVTYDNLVQLACSLRPTWQSPGVKAAIRKALDREAPFTFADLTYAVTSIASDRTVKTPAPISLDGPHWRRDSVPTPLAHVPWEQRCSICSYPERGCSRFADHEFHPNPRRARDTESTQPEGASA